MRPIGQQWRAGKADLDSGGRGAEIPYVIPLAKETSVSTVTRLTRSIRPRSRRKCAGRWASAGDQVEFSVEGSTVTLRKAEPAVRRSGVPAVQAHAMRDGTNRRTTRHSVTFRRRTSSRCRFRSPRGMRSNAVRLWSCRRMSSIGPSRLLRRMITTARHMQDFWTTSRSRI